TTYETIRKVLDMPGGNDNKPKPGITKAQLEKMAEFIVRVQVRSENGVSVIKVEDQVVAQADLLGRLSQFVKTTQKKQMLLDAKGVEWGTIVNIMDDARAAGVQ